ncbi:MAG TPA: DNA-formamidopyrimidine glycosylase family protein, partial [Steroidobacteraceae bacterium]|nr:DNA-formamidopyrimidine glycosylase family protein [Steroidobacteraceae bacterium]
MPELPEVETTRRGIARHLTGRRIREVRVHDGRLRWPVDPGMAVTVTGQRLVAVQRRAKYLLLRLERGTIILH